MKLALQFFAVAIWFLLGLYSTNVWADCATTPDTAVMDQIALQYAKTVFPTKEPIAALPFYDNSIELRDPILAEGMPYAFYDWLGQTSDRLVPPVVILQTLDDLKISGEALAGEASAKAVAEALKARFVIYGSVQRTTDQRMRFFISVYDHKAGGTLSPTIQFATPLNDLFFQNLRTDLAPLAKTLGLKTGKTDANEPLAKLQTFRYYVKGLSYTRRYDEGTLNLSLSWFDKALKDSLFTDPNVAREAALSHFKLALLYRLTGRNPSDHWREAQRLIHDFAPINRKKPQPKQALTARFLANQEHITNAVNLYKNNHKGDAGQESAAGFANVPEDGQIAWLNGVLNGSSARGAYPLHDVCIPEL